MNYYLANWDFGIEVKVRTAHCGCILEPFVCFGDLKEHLDLENAGMFFYKGALFVKWLIYIPIFFIIRCM